MLDPLFSVLIASFLGGSAIAIRLANMTTGAAATSRSARRYTAAATLNNTTPTKNTRRQSRSRSRRGVRGPSMCRGSVSRSTCTRTPQNRSLNSYCRSRSHTSPQRGTSSTSGKSKTPITPATVRKSILTAPLKHTSTDHLDLLVDLHTG